MSTLRPLGLKGRDVLHRRLSLGARARMPADYQPAERSYPNLQHLRFWRSQPGSSCVGHGYLHAREIATTRWGGSMIEPLSRLHAYTLGLLQQTRRGDDLQDEGTYIDSVLTAGKRVGVCAERLFPPTRENVAKRPSIEAEAEGLSKMGGDWWQIHGTGEEHVRQICFAIDTFGAVIVGKEVGNVYADWQGEGVMPAPGPREVSIGGHCTVLAEYSNQGRQFLEINSWSVGTWGFQRGVVGNDGVTRQIGSLANVSKDWLKHSFHMNAYVWIPDEYPEAA